LPTFGASEFGVDLIGRLLDLVDRSSPTDDGVSRRIGAIAQAVALRLDSGYGAKKFIFEKIPQNSKVAMNSARLGCEKNPKICIFQGVFRGGGRGLEPLP